MQTELPPIPYYAGLLDSLARVRFNIHQNEEEMTFTVRSSLRIRTRNNDYLISLIGEFLEAYDIEFDLFSRENGYDYFNVPWNKDIEKVKRLLEGESAQLIRELSFVLGPYVEHFDTEVMGPLETYQLVTAIYNLFFDQQLSPLNWHPKPEEFANEFDIDTGQIDEISIPLGVFRDDYPVEYVAGIIDALANFRPGIHRSSYGIGYGMTPRIQVHRGGVHPAFALSVEQFCDKAGLKYNSAGGINTLNTIVNGASAIDAFAPEVGPYMIAKKEELAYLHEELVPRFLNGEHHSKQGFYDMLVDFQPIDDSGMKRNRSRQYTPEYFEEEWENEIEPVGHDSTNG
jgi:5-methylcytosine-specific restriction protein A